MSDLFKFEPVSGAQGERLGKETGHMYVEGFIRSHPDAFFMPAQFESVAKSIYEFEVREDDIWVITFPKCGKLSRIKIKIKL